MDTQKQQSKEKKSHEGLEGLKERFQEEKSHEAQVHDRYRKVRLVHYQSCGCGLEDIEIEREVPYDSPWQDGDRITELEEADSVLAPHEYRFA